VYYVIKRIGDGKLVAVSGSKHSYTRSLNNAQLYRSKEEAEGNCCGNEVAVEAPLNVK
jgi:hypothetical protein